jgi:acyl-CoA synthetase (AMP-forming)/AMP-acid ligase II
MSYANVARFLDANAGARPGVDALVTPECRFTHDELRSAVNRWARLLDEQGVGQGDRVIIAADADHRVVLLMLALAKVGAIAVPCNVRWAAPEVTYAIELCEPALLVADEVHGWLLDNGAKEASFKSRSLSLDELDTATAELDDSDPGYAEVGLDDPLRILFTSGTTSRPKAVVTTHGNSAWNHRTVGVDLGVSASDRVAVCYPLFHVSGLEAPGVFGTLANGATVLLLPRARASEVAAFIGAERGTGAVLLPPLYSEVLDDDFYTDQLDSLRWVVTGAVTPTSMATFVRRFPGRRLIEVFAMTEATGAATVLDEARMLDKAGRTGRAVRHVEVRVVDEARAPVPVEVPGLIELRGPKISSRYWGEEDVRPDGWFATGDIGDLDADGYLSYRGRAKEMIKSGGENVALAEVERVVMQYPGVYAVCLVRIPHERWGEVSKAFVMPEIGATLAPDALRTHCREQLAGYKVPHEWEVVEDLPFNHSGKVLRRVLQAREDERRESAGL